MSFGQNMSRINKLVTGRDIIRSCSAPKCCTECHNYHDDSHVAIMPYEQSRRCEHPSTFGESLSGFPVQDKRPQWCPYHTSVVRNNI